MRVTVKKKKSKKMVFSSHMLSYTKTLFFLDIILSKIQDLEKLHNWKVISMLFAKNKLIYNLIKSILVIESSSFLNVVKRCSPIS